MLGEDEEDLEDESESETEVKPVEGNLSLFWYFLFTGNVASLVEILFFGTNIASVQRTCSIMWAEMWKSPDLV